MKIQELLKEDVSAPEFNAEKIRALAIESGYKRLPKLDGVINKIENALRSGECVSTAFDEIKYEINSLVEHSFKFFVANPYFYNKDASMTDEIYWDIGHVHGSQELKFYPKKLSKASSEAKQFVGWHAMVKFSEDFSPLTPLLQWLKDHKVSAAAKKKEASDAKKEESNSYMKKFVAHKDVKKVIDLLTELSKQKRDEIFNNEFNFLKIIANKIIEEANKDGITYSKMYNTFSKFPMQGFIFSRMVNRKGEVNSDWEDFIKKMAQDAADQIIDGFIYKNTSKIAFIIFSKNNMKDVKLANVNIGQGKVECDLHFEFDDNSKFTATSSVVGAVSKLGNWFYRYPTTFHNVIMPDGKKLSGPSEQKMEEVFAVS